MARTAPRLPFASAGGKPEISILDDGWDKIEKAYGSALSKEVRNSILQATQRFVDWEVFERTAEPLSDARKRLTLVRKKAGELRQLTLGPARSTDSSIYTKHLIKKYFADRSLPKEDCLRQIYSLLGSLMAACDKGLKEIENSDLEAFKQGDAWDQWIRDLTSIAKKNDLKWRVRQDADKQSDANRLSPFAALIRDLQGFLPQKCKRRPYADTALPKAINRARSAAAAKRDTKQATHRSDKSRNRE